MYVGGILSLVGGLMEKMGEPYSDSEVTDKK